ncbi:hypothetical protein HDU98_005009 [Podochytrium sp. JEL0797]|nr:hypothetical protein HDU98_005009 [Podochytrium sp. JEL0797]
MTTHLAPPTSPALSTLPHELKLHIASHLPATSLLSLALTAHTFLDAALPHIWKSPRLAPLARVAEWRRFLDAIAASRLGLTMGVYHLWVQRVEDLGMFVGGEDEGVEGVEDGVCWYAYPREEGKVVGRRDSKVDCEGELGGVDSEVCEMEEDCESSVVELCDEENESENVAVIHPQRRVHLLDSDSLPSITPFAADSIHYGIALLLTHCPNIHHVNLQLPLPPPPLLAHFPLHLHRLNLKTLEIILPHLLHLHTLTIKASPGTEDYTGDATVEEVDVLALPAFWTGSERSGKRFVLVGVDFVRSGDGVMRSYYSVGGGGDLGELRGRWDKAWGGGGVGVELVIRGW